MIKNNRNNYNDKLYVSTPYRPEPSSFATYKSFNKEVYRIINWHYCRDVFNPYLYKIDIFFYAHKLNKGINILYFMQKIEKKLIIFSDYGPTQKKSIMWIRPSKWWTTKPIRRSLLTLLIRCGENYDFKKNNFKDALFSDPYSKATKYAINRFLSGHTHYTGSKKGWFDQFDENKFSKKYIDSLLSKPI